MGKPYSLDLRKRVVAATEGGMSRNQAAKQFGVAISTAIGWMRRVGANMMAIDGAWQRPSTMEVKLRPENQFLLTIIEEL